MLLDSLSDSDLLERTRADNAVAFRMLYQRHWRRCFSLAYQKLSDKNLAEDITQTVFVSLWEHRKDLTINNLEAYLATAVKYQIFNYFDAQLSRQKLAERVLSHHTPPQYLSDNSTENALFLQDLKTALDRALVELPEKTRTIYEMSRSEHLPQKEIARQLDLSEKAVEYHISQALRLLRERLKDFLIISWVVYFL
jgi:RNA polymerase sigma-70 factor (family 1)